MQPERQLWKENVGGFTFLYHDTNLLKSIEENIYTSLKTKNSKFLSKLKLGFHTLDRRLKSKNVNIHMRIKRVTHEIVHIVKEIMQFYS